MNPTLLNEVTGTVDRVRSAIAQASRRTGMDFDYLYKQASIESGLRPDAKARTSSATGLYQFIDQSWLGALKRHGAKHGLSWAADSISQTGGGRFYISDPASRATIMNMRNQPEASALMAAETASENRQLIERTTGRTATPTDLYMGHFLGPKGAADFLGAMTADPNRRADSVSPAAAASNRGVFYTADGRARTLSEVYDRFAAKMGDDTPLPQSQPVMMADASNADGGTPPLPLGLARALDGAEEGIGLDDVLKHATPENARMAYLMLASMGA